MRSCTLRAGERLASRALAGEADLLRLPRDRDRDRLSRDLDLDLAVMMRTMRDIR
jgi:hypothetical protein